MKVVLGTLLAVILLAAPIDLTADDLDKLRGTWSVVSMIDDGQPVVDPNQGPKVKLAYDEKKWFILVGDKIVAQGYFTIDATKKPKEIDVLDETGKANEKTKLGIYELQGKSYRYCLAPAGKPRPADFTSKAGSGHSLGVMKRD